MLRPFVRCLSTGAKTPNQERYIKALRNPNKPIVVAIGPAGSGKTFLACQEGARSLINSQVSNLVITRPTKTVDEDHGFLPGNIDKKLAPWVQPIYDSLNKCQHFNKDLSKLKLKNNLEIAPLGYMRGRTFDYSYIIADEMQNATISQTKMLLTRLGQDSKLVVTGDLQQTDIYHSGLSHFLNKLEKYPNPQYIEYIELEADDVIRHEAVKEILNIYS